VAELAQFRPTSDSRYTRVISLNDEKLLVVILALALALWLTGCGSTSRSVSSGDFRGAASLASAPRFGVAGVTLSPASVKAGASAVLRVNLDAPAPEGGLEVQLSSSDSSSVSVPPKLRIPAGASSATTAISASMIGDSKTVSITAFSGQTMAASALSIVAATTSSFSVSVSPTSITVADGQSGSAKLTTKIVTGYNQSLQLSASNVPGGVSVKFNSSQIPAPGAGTSKVSVTVASTVPTGTYSIHLKATGGTLSVSTTLTLKVAVNPDARFQGCWYKSNGHSYQGVLASVANPGTYPLDAELYYGTTCNPSNWADEIGFGTDVEFGGFDWIFYFNAFKDQTDMSTRWHVGPDTSACFAYTATTPSCP
jgi:hypothetical protein